MHRWPHQFPASHLWQSPKSTSTHITTDRKCPGMGRSGVDEPSHRTIFLGVVSNERALLYSSTTWRSADPAEYPRFIRPFLSYFASRKAAHSQDVSRSHFHSVFSDLNLNNTSMMSVLPRLFALIVWMGATKSGQILAITTQFGRHPQYWWFGKYFYPKKYWWFGYAKRWAGEGWWLGQHTQPIR